MRILRENTEKLTFAEIDEGDVFQLIGVSSYYLKIYKPENTPYSAVNLTYNELGSIEGSREVIRVGAELNIRG